MKGFNFFREKNSAPVKEEDHSDFISEDRASVLSNWGNVNSNISDNTDNYETRPKGYIFCRKCYEVISERELKCPYCGTVNSRE